MATTMQADPCARLESLIHERESIEASIIGRKEALARAVVSNAEGSLRTIRRELSVLEQRQKEIALGIAAVEPAAKEQARTVAEEQGRDADLEAARLRDAYIAKEFEAEAVLKSLAREWVPAFRELKAAHQAAAAAHDRANYLNGRKGYDPFSVNALPQDRAMDFSYFAIPFVRYGTATEEV